MWHLVIHLLIIMWERYEQKFYRSFKDNPPGPFTTMDHVRFRYENPPWWIIVCMCRPSKNLETTYLRGGNALRLKNRFLVEKTRKWFVFGVLTKNYGILKATQVKWSNTSCQHVLPFAGATCDGAVFTKFLASLCLFAGNPRAISRLVLDLKGARVFTTSRW